MKAEAAETALMAAQARLPVDRFAALRSSLDALVAALAQQQETEEAQRRKAEQLHTDVQNQRQRLAQHDGSILQEGTPQMALHQELLTASNELTLVHRKLQDREEAIDQLKEDLANAKFDLGVSLDSRGDSERIQQIEQQSTGLQAEIDRDTLQASELQEELESLRATVLASRDREAAAAATVQSLQNDMQAANALPQRIANQAGLLVNNKNRCAAELEQLEQTLQNRNQTLVDLRDNLARVQQDTSAVDDAIEAAIADRLRLERLQQQHELTIQSTEEASVDLIGQRALLETQIDSAAGRLHSLDEQVAAIKRHQDRALRELKAAQSKEETLRLARDTAVKERDRVAVAVDARRKEALDIAGGLERLEADLTTSQRAWESTAGVSRAAVAKVQGMHAKNRSLEKELAHLVRQSADLARQHAAVRRAVDHAGAEKLRSLQVLTAQEQHLNSAALGQRDAKRSLDQVGSKVTAVAMLLGTAKNEKNLCLTQINSLQQRLAEMRDKQRMLHTEIEILRASAEEKDVKINEIKADAAARGVILEGLRGEVNSTRQQERELQTQGKNLGRLNQKLLESIEVVEKKLAQLRQEQESVVRQRDFHAKGLVRRQHDLAQLYENLNVTNNTLHQGEMELQEREQDLKLLNAEKAELLRAIRLLNKAVPVKHKLQNDLLESQLELVSCQKRTSELEEQLQSHTRVQRQRPEDETEDLDPVALEEKATRLAERLANKEEQVLERDMVLAETERLLGRALRRLEAGRGDALQATATARDFQMRLNELQLKLKACVSELAMYQTKASQYQREADDLRDTLEMAEANLLANRPPNPEIESEWQRLKRRFKQEWNAALSASMDLTQGLSQTHRQGDYVPDADGALPIAKPFGAQAPFRPANRPPKLRHYRNLVKAPAESAVAMP